MEKIISIDGRDIKLKATGALLLRYKAQFKRDALQDIVKLTNVLDEETGEIKDISHLDLDVFYNLIWTLAKTGNPDIAPLENWLDTFDDFPIIELIPTVMDMVGSCLQTTKKKK